MMGLLIGKNWLNLIQEIKKIVTISELYTGMIGPSKASSITFPGTEFHFNIADTSTFVSITE